MKDALTHFTIIVILVIAPSSSFAEDELPTLPPEGAVVLFAGHSTEGFVGKDGKATDWPIKDGCLVSTAKDVRSNHISSKLHFRDAWIHVEFMMSEAAQGNSGVYIHGHYEMQIIRSSGKKNPTDPPANQEMGALYGIHAPLVELGLKPNQWHVYDIRFQAPRRGPEEKITQPGSITAWINGRKVLDDARFEEPVSVYHPYRYKSTPYLKRIERQLLQTGVGPVFLQDHDSPCRFRNVWVKPLDSSAFFYDGTNTPPMSPSSFDEKGEK